jgi:cell division septation protein DedD
VIDEREPVAGDEEHLDEEAQAGAPEPAAGPSCRSCGEPVDPHQLVCLGCGARVALKEHRSWATEPLAPIAALLVVVIVIGAGLFGFAISELTSDDGGGDQVAEQQPAAAERDEAREETPAAEGPAVVSGSEQETESSTETTPEPAADPNAIPGWPSDVSAHTVVLVTTSDGPAARNVAREARGAGLEAGLIRSDPYNLGSGLWIVFTGRFDTREGAVRQAAGLQDRYPGAYPQLIQRSQ